MEVLKGKKISINRKIYGRVKDIETGNENITIVLGKVKINIQEDDQIEVYQKDRWIPLNEFLMISNLRKINMDKEHDGNHEAKEQMVYKGD